METDRRSERSKKRTIRLMVGLTGLCIVGLLASWWHMISGDPELDIPDPAMPQPNAFDYYVAAGKALVQEQQFDNINGVTPTARMTLKQKEAVIEQNAAALQSLHQGFAYEYRNPPVRSNFTELPHMKTFREVARLLKAQSRVRAAQGDWGGAADSALDAIRMGEDIPRGGGLLVQLNGEACQALGQRALWDLLEHLNAAQSRVVIIRLTGILERHVPYADTLQEEKWTEQATLKELFQTITPRNALANATQWTDSDASPAQRYWTALALLYDRRGILRNYTEFMDVTIAQARQPYAAKLPPPIPSDFFSQLEQFTYVTAHFGDVYSETKNGLLLTTLALHAYHLEHGHAPATLAELAPAYLRKLPEDPFALQGTFKYLPRGQSSLLYSIGPDGKDDGGTPIDDPKHASAASPLARYRVVRRESVGDIVAGINFP